MADEPITKWTGLYGTEYEYRVNPIGTTYKAIPGNYIFARMSMYGDWIPIYVGETDNLRERLTESHEKMECVNRYGGTHIHTHVSSDSQKERCKEESDIIDKWNPPCNLE